MRRRLSIPNLVSATQAAAGKGKELKEAKEALEKAQAEGVRKDKLLAAETQRADCFQRVTETQKERVETLVARNKSLEVSGRTIHSASWTRRGAVTVLTPRPP